MGINHITLMGTIVRGPEKRVTNAGIPTAEFTVAVVRPSRAEGASEITDYIRVVSWRALAEKVAQAFQKGSVVVVEGRLSTRSFEKDGQRRKAIDVDANVVEGIPGGAVRGQASDDEPIFDEPFDEPVSKQVPAPVGRVVASEPPELDDEIPF